MFKRFSQIAGLQARRFLAGILVAAAGLAVSNALPVGISTSALAQTSCQIDFGILTKKRMAQIAALNRDAKRRKGKLDPRTACPRLRNLAAVEGEMLAYMKKNKSWCGIPDQPIEQMTTTRRKTAALAGQACKAARAMRNAVANARRQQQAGGGAGAPQRPKLPSGPL